MRINILAILMIAGAFAGATSAQAQAPADITEYVKVTIGPNEVLSQAYEREFKLPARRSSMSYYTQTLKADGNPIDNVDLVHEGDVLYLKKTAAFIAVERAAPRITESPAKPPEVPVGGNNTTSEAKKEDAKAGEIPAPTAPKAHQDTALEAKTPHSSESPKPSLVAKPASTPAPTPVRSPKAKKLSEHSAPWWIWVLPVFGIALLVLLFWPQLRKLARSKVVKTKRTPWQTNAWTPMQPVGYQKDVPLQDFDRDPPAGEATNVPETSNVPDVLPQGGAQARAQEIWSQKLATAPPPAHPSFPSVGPDAFAPVSTTETRAKDLGLTVVEQNETNIEEETAFEAEDGLEHEVMPVVVRGDILRGKNAPNREITVDIYYSAAEQTFDALDGHKKPYDIPKLGAAILTPGGPFQHKFGLIIDYSKVTPHMMKHPSNIFVITQGKGPYVPNNFIRKAERKANTRTLVQAGG